jgi:DNA invertase Pin-like site-specific DNA recombinase
VYPKGLCNFKLDTQVGYDYITRIKNLLLQNRRLTVKYGYARVSTREQDLSIQETALKAAGCELVRAEKMSGTRREGRAELELLLEFVRPGDELMVTRIDRLARSIGDLQDIVRSLQAKGVALRATEQPIDTTTAAGKCFLDMLGVFAEFETNLRKERQLEGIAKAKAAGVYKGRKRSVPVDEVKQLKAQGRSPTEIAEELEISRMSVYRVLKDEAAGAR